MPALAMTDHGYLYGAHEFWRKAQGTGVKPIIGLEAYVTPGTHRTDKTRVKWGDERTRQGDDVSGSGAYTHMTLLAKNNNGLRNLFQMDSLASLDQVYAKWPRLDRELLERVRPGPHRHDRLPLERDPDPAAAGPVRPRQAGGERLPRHLRRRELLLRGHGPPERDRAPHDQGPAAAGQGARPPAARDQRQPLHLPRGLDGPRRPALRPVRLDAHGPQPVQVRR